MELLLQDTDERQKPPRKKCFRKHSGTTATTEHRRKTKTAAEKMLPKTSWHYNRTQTEDKNHRGKKSSENILGLLLQQDTDRKKTIAEKKLPKTSWDCYNRTQTEDKTTAEKNLPKTSWNYCYKTQTEDKNHPGKNASENILGLLLQQDTDRKKDRRGKKIFLASKIRTEPH